MSQYIIIMLIITQRGDSALIMAVERDRTEFVSRLLETGANTDLQNKVHYKGVKVFGNCSRLSNQPNSFDRLQKLFVAIG